MSYLKLLAQWNEAFTSSALNCSLSCIPVQGGREGKIPLHRVWAAGLARGWVAGLRTGEGMGQCFVLTLVLFAALIAVSDLVDTEIICWRVGGGVAAVALLVWGGTAVKPSRRGPTLTNLTGILGCSVFSFSIPEGRRSVAVHTCIVQLLS